MQGLRAVVRGKGMGMPRVQNLMQAMGPSPFGTLDEWANPAKAVV